MKTVKKNQIQILQLRIKISKIMTSLYGFNSRLDIVKQKINELEHKSIQILLERDIWDLLKY